MTTKDSILKNLLKEDANEKILFEQYKLYVKMANDISNRRNNTNKFYVALISLLISIFSIITSITHELIIFIAPLTITIGISYIWMKNIESYSILNRGKFDVINEIENKLPVKGFTIEWELMESYNYKELTAVEKKVPKIICIIAIIAIILIILILFIQKGYCIF